MTLVFWNIGGLGEFGELFCRTRTSYAGSYLKATPSHRRRSCSSMGESTVALTQ